MRLNIILARYLFIFLLFAVFLLLLFVPVYSYITNFTLRNELVRISNRMEQGITELNSVFTALDIMKTTNSSDSRFSVFKSWAFNTGTMEPKTLWELRDSINKTLFPYSLPADTGLLFPNGMAVTRNIISFYSDLIPFYGVNLQCGDLTLDEWRGQLASGRSFLPVMPYTSAYYADYDAITYAASWDHIGFPENAVFFAALPVDGITALLTDADVAQAACVKMYSAGGELLFSRGIENNNVGKTSHVVSGESQNYSIHYEINIPHSFISGKLKPVRNQMLLFICLTAVFVVILSFLFAWRSSLPERSFMERISPAETPQTGFDIFSGFNRMFLDVADTISTEKKHLETSLRTIEIQTALIRSQTIDRIRKALLCGNETLSKTTLRDCVAALPDPEDPLVAAFLSRMLSAMICDLSEELPGIIQPEETPEYVPSSQKEIFEQYYPDYFARICESIRIHKENSVSPLGHNVLAWINEHLYDPDLYITMVADHFNISAPTLQKLVKQYTGQTFQNYVEKGRLDHACELLLGSNDTIVRVAKVCGFSRSSSFNRSFKRVYGFPPSRLQETGVE